MGPLEHNPPLQSLSALEWAVSHAFRTVLLVIREVQSRHFHFTEGAKHFLQWTGRQVFVQSIPPLNLSTTIGALYLHKCALLPMVLHFAFCMVVQYALGGCFSNPILRVYPPKFCRIIVSNSSLDKKKSHEKLKTMPM